MKKTTILLLSVFFVATLAAKTSIREQILRNLNRGNTLSYTVEKLTIQGESTKEKYSADTTFIRTYSSASFTKMKSDTLFGYHYVTIDSLIHPYFKTPLKTTCYYNGTKILRSFVMPGQTTFSDTEVAKIDKDELEAYVEAEIVAINKLLNNKTTKQQNDTVINHDGCFHFSTIIDDRDHSLYVSKKTLFPVLYRITTSRIQPFIEEYYYKRFTNAKAFVIPNFDELKAKVTPTVVPLKGNDSLPNWILTDTKGNSISFAKPDRYNIIFLSMINCGPCHEAIPAVHAIYSKYNNTDSTDVYVFYPMDQPDELNKYIKSKNIQYTIVYNSLKDENKKMVLRGKLLFPYPTMIIVKDNKIIYKITGYTKNYENEIVKRIEAVMTAKK